MDSEGYSDDWSAYIKQVLSFTHIIVRERLQKWVIGCWCGSCICLMIGAQTFHMYARVHLWLPERTWGCKVKLLWSHIRDARPFSFQGCLLKTWMHHRSSSGERICMFENWPTVCALLWTHWVGPEQISALSFSALIRKPYFSVQHFTASGISINISNIIYLPCRQYSV